MDFLNNKKTQAGFKIIAALALGMYAAGTSGVLSVASVEWPASIIALLVVLIVYTAWSVTETFVPQKGAVKILKRVSDGVFFTGLGAGVVYSYIFASGTSGLSGWQLFEHMLRVTLIVFVSVYAFSPQGRVRTMLHRTLEPVFWVLTVGLLYKSGSVLLTNTVSDAGAYAPFLMPAILTLFGLFAIIGALKLAQKWMFSRTEEQFKKMKATMQAYRKVS